MVEKNSPPPLPEIHEEEDIVPHYGKEYFPQYDEEEKEAYFLLPEYEKSLAYAGFQERLMATILDMTIVTLVIGVPEQWIFQVLGIMPPIQEIHDYSVFVHRLVLSYVIAGLLYVLYCLGCWVKWGATPGKRLLGLRIVDDRTGIRLSRRQSIARAGWYVISAVPCMLGFFWILGQRRKQGWHDLASHTVVIYNKNRYRLLWQWGKRTLLQRLQKQKNKAAS